MPCSSSTCPAAATKTWRRWRSVFRSRLMSRIDAAFRSLRKAGRVGLVTYVTAGDPDLERSRDILVRIARGGADILEVGVPFSDPLADGPVIQRATERALAAGSTLVKVLGMVSDVRSLINS